MDDMKRDVELGGKSPVIVPDDHDPDGRAGRGRRHLLQPGPGPAPPVRGCTWPGVACTPPRWWKRLADLAAGMKLGPWLCTGYAGGTAGARPATSSVMDDIGIGRAEARRCWWRRRGEGATPFRAADENADGA